MALLIDPLEAMKTSAELLLDRSHNFARKRMTLNGSCGVLKTLEVFDKERVGQPQIFSAKFRHDGAQRQFVFFPLHLGISRACRDKSVSEQECHECSDCLASYHGSSPGVTLDGSLCFKTVSQRASS